MKTESQSLEGDTASATDSGWDLARKGDSESLAALIDAGLSVDACNERGDTFLLLASYYAREDCVKMLINRSAQIDLANSKGQRPLTGACFKGYLAIVKLLIEAGARLEENNPEIKTPLMFAASYEHVAIVRFLLDTGANAKAKTADGKTALDLARDNLAHGVVDILAPEQTGKEDVSGPSDYDWTRM